MEKFRLQEGKSRCHCNLAVSRQDLNPKGVASIALGFKKPPSLTLPRSQSHCPHTHAKTAKSGRCWLLAESGVGCRLGFLRHFFWQKFRIAWLRIPRPFSHSQVFSFQGLHPQLGPQSLFSQCKFPEQRKKLNGFAFPFRFCFRSPSLALSVSLLENDVNLISLCSSSQGLVLLC